METESIPIGTLHEDPANLRTHSARNIAAIKASLARFGQQKPIVIDADNVIRAGNGTIEAARQLGWEAVDAVRSNLIGSEMTAFAIADNRTAELAEWDYEVLGQVLGALEAEEAGRAADLGWADHELANILAADWTPPEPSEDLEGFSVTSPEAIDRSEGALTISFSQDEGDLIEEYGITIMPDEVFNLHAVIMAAINHGLGRVNE